MKKLILSCLVMFSTLAMAQEVPTKEPMQGNPSKEMEAHRLANDLIKYGHSQQLALPLINALQIMSDTPSQAGRAEKVDGGDASKDGGVSFDVKAIIEEAKNYADGDANLLSLIAEIEKQQSESHRGAVGGPCRQVEILRPNHYITYNVNFVANSLAEVAVQGDGDTDLDLYVYDSNGNLVASDEDYSDDCYVNWVPKWTGRFVVKIVNRGGVPNRFVVVTN